MAKSFSSPDMRRGVLASACALMMAVSHAWAAEGEALPAALPLLFDAREHLPLPDISAYPRIRFLTTADFPPFNFADQGDRLSGFHIDLVREICTALSMDARCQIQALPFGELEQALVSGQAEAVIAGVAMTASRRSDFAFSRSYMLLPARFAVRRELAGQRPGTQPEWRVGVVSGSVHEAMYRAYFPQGKVEGFDSQSLLLEGLAKGNVDAVFADALRLSFWTAGAASANCCALLPGAYVSERFLGEGLGIMVRRDDAALARAFDHALAELAASGRLEEIYLRYFPTSLF